MAEHAQEIEGIIRFKFQDNADAMAKGTRHITLLYHQVCLNGEDWIELEC